MNARQMMNMTTLHTTFGTHCSDVEYGKTTEQENREAWLREWKAEVARIREKEAKKAKKVKKNG